MVRDTPEWKDFIEKGAFNPTALAATDFAKWLESAEVNHKTLMTEAGFMAK